MKEVFLDGLSKEEWIKEKIKKSREELKREENYIPEEDKRVAKSLLSWCKKEDERRNMDESRC